MESITNHSEQLSNPSRNQVTLGRDVAEFSGRVLLAAIYLISGIGKISAYSGTAAYMESAGVPGQLLPLVIATELLGAIAIIIGYQTRLAAFLLAGFTLLAGMIFNHNVADQNDVVHLLKNLAIAGGFLVLWSNGAGALSLDRRIEQRRVLSRIKSR